MLYLASLVFSSLTVCLFISQSPKYEDLKGYIDLMQIQPGERSEAELESLPTPVTQSRKVTARSSGVEIGSKDGQKSEARRDELEQSLQSKASEDVEIRKFLIDYHQFKTRRCDELFAQLLKYYVTDPPDDLLTPLDDSTSNIPIEAKKTFSDCLETLRVSLHAGRPGSLRICFLIWDGSDALQSQLYSLPQRLFATADGLQRRYDAPRQAIIHLINQEWKLSTAALKACASDEALRHLRHTRRPAKDLSSSYYSTDKTPSQTRYKGNAANSSDRIDFQDFDAEISLDFVWLAQVPRYLGRVSNYIWQPHIKPPNFKSIRIFMNGSADEGRKALLLYRSKGGSGGPLFDYTTFHRQTRAGNPPETTNVIVPESMTLLQAVYFQILFDTALFVESAYEQIDKLRYTGRSKAENGKLHYLLHFKDCCRTSSSGLEHASSILQDISSSLANVDVTENEERSSWPDTVARDLQNYQDQLITIEDEVAELRHMIEKQLEIQRGQQTTLLTVLAAIYIPLSFMSSLFGMNLKTDPFWPRNQHDKRANQPLEPANLTSTTALQNSTDAIVYAIDSSGPYLFSFNVYWAVAIPVTITTIIVPLLAGTVFRATLKTFYRNRTTLRFFVLLLGLGAVISLDLLTPRSVSLIIFGLILGTSALVTLIKASTTGKDQLVWCGYSAVFAAFETTDIFFPIAPFPTSGYFCFFYLIMVWLGPHLITSTWPNVRIKNYPRQILHYIRSSEPTGRPRTIWRICLIVVYLAFTSMCLILIPFDVFITVFAITFGILAINRIVRSFVLRKNLGLWSIYKAVFWLAFAIDVYLVRTGPVKPGLTGFFPMSYLFGAWTYLDHKAYFDILFRRSS